MIKILDTNLLRLGVINKAIKANRVEAINGENTLDFSSILESKLNDLIDGDSIFESEGEYFDIATFEKVLNDDNSFIVNVEADHVSYRLNDPLYNVEYFTYTGTPTFILGKILEDTDFSVGALPVEFTGDVTYSAQEAKSRRQILMEFVTYLSLEYSPPGTNIGGELSFSGFVVSIVLHRGTSGVKTVLKDKNIKIVSKKYSKRELDELGNPKVSYLCTPIYLPTDTYVLGDTIRLIQPDLDIDEQLRVVKLSYNPYDNMDRTFELANYVNALESQLYRISTSSVTKNKKYHGCRIGPDYGFECVRSDKKTRSYFNSDSLAFQTGDGSGELANWVDRLSFKEIPEGSGTWVLVLDGKLSASTIEAAQAEFKTVVVNNLMANKAYIAELTVDSLETSDKVKNYLNADVSDVCYIKIYNQNIEFIEAVTTGTYTEFVADRDGNDLYWTEEPIPENNYGITTDITAWQVTQYFYTEVIKLKISFQSINGLYTPIMQWGIGTGVGDNGKGFWSKTVSGFELMYVTNDIEQKIINGDDGIMVSGVGTKTKSLRNISVSNAEPTDPEVNDIWIDTN